MLKRIIRYSILAVIGLYATCGNASLSVFDNLDQQAKVLSAKARNLNPHVVKLALVAYYKAHTRGIGQRDLLTIVDYSKPSTQTRLWVLDVKNNHVLYQELVSHGKNSGDDVATSFSNSPRSEKSSLGLYLTENTYTGHNGYSLRLAGLEKGFNDLAEERAIVIHPAYYASRNYAAMTGRLGRSWGCFALDPRVSGSVIKTIKGGTLLFAYYPNSKWLHNSKYLT